MRQHMNLALLFAGRTFPHLVIAGFIPAIHGAEAHMSECVARWIAGINPAMTSETVTQRNLVPSYHSPWPASEPAIQFGNVLPPLGTS